MQKKIFITRYQEYASRALCSPLREFAVFSRLGRNRWKVRVRDEKRRRTRRDEKWYQELEENWKKVHYNAGWRGEGKGNKQERNSGVLDAKENGGFRKGRDKGRKSDIMMLLFLFMISTHGFSPFYNVP